MQQPEQPHSSWRSPGTAGSLWFIYFDCNPSCWIIKCLVASQRNSLPTNSSRVPSPSWSTRENFFGAAPHCRSQQTSSGSLHLWQTSTHSSCLLVWQPWTRCTEPHTMCSMTFPSEQNPGCREQQRTINNPLSALQVKLCFIDETLSDCTSYLQPCLSYASGSNIQRFYFCKRMRLQDIHPHPYATGLGCSRMKVTDRCTMHTPLSRY